MELEPAPGAVLRFTAITNTEEPGPVMARVRNVGGGVLEIRSVQVQGSDRFEVLEAPAELRPGQEGEIWVALLLDREGALTAELVVQGNDPELPEARLGLDARESERCLPVPSVNALELRFNQPQSFELRNLGLADCTLTEIEELPGRFVVTPPIELPRRLPARGSLSVQVNQISYTREIEPPTHTLGLVFDAQRAEVELLGEARGPCLFVGASRVEFPLTQLGQTSERSLTVENRCEWDYEIASARFLEEAPSGFGMRSLTPMTVPAFTTVEVMLLHSPTQRVIEEAVLRLSTTDPLSVTWDVELVGRGGDAVPFIFPGQLDFQTVIFQNPSGPQMQSQCGARSQLVQIHNIGDLPLSVQGLSFALDPQFSIDSVLIDDAPVNPTPPFELQPGSAAKVSLRFYPVREGAHQGALQIQTSKGATSVDLIGFGVAAGPVTDRFVQPAGPKVDILWAIDNSCSMEDEQQLLVQNLSSFVGYADSLGADYQMAVTIADSERPDAGLFEACPPHPSVVSSSYATAAEREAAFACMFRVGTSGGRREAGLGASVRALQRASSVDQDPATNPNAGFLRPDAKLAIVVISDEDDQSLEPDELMRDYFFSVKGGKLNDLVSVHAIAGPPDGGCAEAMPGSRYLWMTEQTQGRFQSICSSNWAPVLTELGLDIFTLFSEWRLSQSADPGTLVVSVGGRSIAEDMQNGYSFSAGENSIQLHGSAVPEPGETVEIRYQGLCRP